MNLVGGRFMDAVRVDSFLDAEAPLPHAAVILLGNPLETRDIGERWVTKQADLVVMLVDLVDDVIRIQGITLRDPRMDALLSALREIVERVGPESKEERVVQIQLAATQESSDDGSGSSDGCESPSGGAEGPPAQGEGDATPPPNAGRPLLEAATNWLHHVLRDAIERVPSDNGDVPGLSLTRTTLLQSLEPPPLRTADDRPEGIDAASDKLDAALAAAVQHAEQYPEPLAVFARAVPVSRLELRLVALRLRPRSTFGSSAALASCSTT